MVSLFILRQKYDVIERDRFIYRPVFVKRYGFKWGRPPVIKRFSNSLFSNGYRMEVDRVEGWTGGRGHKGNQSPTR